MRTAGGVVVNGQSGEMYYTWAHYADAGGASVRSNSVVDMEIKAGFCRTGTLDTEAIRRQAEQAGYTTFVLPEKGIIDRGSFFDAVRATFPLDPPRRVEPPGRAGGDE